MTQLLILADDFTGALDTGVQFTASGANVRVITGQQEDLAACAPTCEVLVVDAETRHLSPDAAGAVVGRYAAQAVALGIRHIYKKTDSALRGNIGAELAAVLAASGAEELPFLPAFPQIGRKTLGGVHYIQDTPVAESVFGADPFEPVVHSFVPDLIAAQTTVPAVSVPALAEESPLPQSKGIWVIDAESVEQLRSSAARLARAGKLTVLAGCAGFAAVLPELLGLGTGNPRPIPRLDERFTVICGSVNPITVAQVAYARANGFAHRSLEPSQKLSDAYWHTPEGEQTLQELFALLENSPRRILDTNDPEGNQKTAEYAATLGLDIQGIRRAVSGTIGYLVSRLFPHEALGTLMITGGDTLLQCMDYMGVHEIEPLGELAAGVVLSRFAYHGLTRYVISKSGGFGEEDLLLRLAQRIGRI